MANNSIIIIGSGGHAISCADVIQSEGIFNIAGFVSNKIILNPILGISIVGVDEDLPQLVQTYQNACIGIGQIESSLPRSKIFEYLKTIGFELPVIVSPAAYISPKAKIGKGSIVMHGAVINAGAVIGANCIINSMALIEHGANIGDNCHISTGAIINGDVSIGSNCFVGSRAVIRNGISIGANSFLGIGLTVLTSVPSLSIIKNEK